MADPTLDFNICQLGDCENFIFTETTGAYNATYNTTGWDSPNTATTSATAATLTITDPDGLVNIVNLYTASYPTSTTTQQYVIYGGNLGYSGAMPDGEWTFTYTITTASSTITQIKKVFFYCNVKCCVYNMFTAIKDLTCGDCIFEKEREAITAMALLESLQNAADCGQSTYFANILSTLNKLCADSTCKTC